MRFLTNNSLTREQAEQILTSPKAKIAVDIETVSTENRLPLGVGIATSRDDGFYFFNPYDEMLKRIFDSTDTIITHNGKFDLPIMRELGLTVKNYEDTRFIAYSCGMLENSLEALSISVLHRECPSVTSQWRSMACPTCNKKTQLGNIGIDHVKMAGFCIIHATNTFMLEEILPKTELYLTIDKPFIDLIMEMEYWGLKIDQYRLTKVEQAVVERAFPMEAELKEALSVENVNSNPQVATALRNIGIIGTRKTKSDKDSVSEDSLKPLNLPLTNKLLKWRSLMKTITTYVPAFRNVDHRGRVCSNYGQTNTGRLSSSKPNQQNITRDNKFTEEEE